MSNKLKYQKSLEEATKLIRLEYDYKCTDFNLNCHECQLHLAADIMEDELMLLDYFNSKKVKEVRKLGEEEIEKFLKGFAYKKKKE